MTEGGATTTYTYDDWGRTISKADGTHSATYGFAFLGSAAVPAARLRSRESLSARPRRIRATNLLPNKHHMSAASAAGYGGTPPRNDADRTWYRWDAGWNVIGEYAAGTDTGTTWDVGALARWYQGKTAHADGDPDSTAYNYYAHDHLGSPRTTYSQSQAVLARIEFTPYGSPMTTTGQDIDLGYTGHKWERPKFST